MITIFTTGVQARDARNLITKGATLSKKVYEGVQASSLNIDTDLMRSIAVNRDRTITVDLPVDGKVLTLDLIRHDVLPFTTPVTVMTDRGPELYSTRNIAVYRGTIPGVTNSIVSLVVTPTTVVGMIDAGGRRTVIGPDRENTDAFAVATINSSDATSKLPCQTPDDAISQRVLDIMREAYAKPHESVQANDTLLMQVAVEADYQLYTGMDKNIGKATAYIAQLFSVASQIYERDLQTKMTLSFVRVWSVQGDPYPDQTNIFGLIDPFKAYYKVVMDTVKRDIAVLLTMRGPQGGIAGSIGGLCEPNGSFAACDLEGKVNPLPTYSWDAMVVTHEIGHVCGGVHTQSCIWPGGPLDSCIASEDGNCVTWEMTKPIKGTIMSYCHQRGTIELTFHPRHRIMLREFIERASCIGGRTVAQRRVLTGRFLDATTKQPIPGVSLKAIPYVDEVVSDQPRPTGDSISITDANGRFRFQGLGSGLLDIVIPPIYTEVPFTWFKATNVYSTMIADSLTDITIYVTKAQPVTFDISFDPTTTNARFFLVSDVLSDFYKEITLSTYILRNNLPLTVSLRPGKYALLPMTAGRRFEPETVVINVPADKPADTVRMSITKDNGVVPTMQIAALTLFESEDRRVSLSPGENGSLLNYTTRALAASLQSGDRAAFYKSGVDSRNTYTIDPDYDTTQFVISSDPPYFYASSGMNRLVKRVRSFPLIARPYVFSAFSSTWSPVSNGTVLIDSGSAVAVREAIPFEFRFGEKVIDSVRVTPNGIVYASDEELYSTNVNSVQRADMILLPLANYSTPRFDSVKGAVLTEIRGVAPSRIFVIEWKNLGQQQYGSTYYWAGAMNFQLHLHEGTGTIDFVYGPMDCPAGIEFGANVGIRGKDALDFQRVSLTVGSIQEWSKVFAATSTPFTPFTLDSLRKPESGQTYRFEHPTTSIEEDVPQQTLSVSPNPASEAFMVQWPADLNINAFDVVDVRGAIVDHVSVTSTTTSLKVDVSKLATGRYWIISKGASTVTTPFTIAR
ncbi:MAG: M12 family metallo-peptidase [Candidatus Kapabacteria bacterium]|nr:M12 family metallo-peptidase [Candidatus Kapabacteria bacterium]